jgi:hypothetical protein
VPFLPGETFRIKEVGSPHHHLYVILGSDPQRLIAVRLNSVTALTDQTVTLTVGDHPFVRHDTAVSYDAMRDMDVSKLAELERLSADSAAPMFEWGDPCSAELLGRLRCGAFRSERSTPRITKMLSSMLGMDA